MTAVRLRLTNQVHLTNRVSRCRALLLGLALLVAACSGGADDAIDEQPVTDEPGIEAEDSSGVEGQDEPGQEAGAGGEQEAEEEPLAERVLTDTFTPLGEPGVGGRITSIAFDPDNPERVFVGGDLLGIAVTDDFGQTWQSTTGLASWEIADINTAQTADGRIWTCLLYTSPSRRDS